MYTVGKVVLIGAVLTMLVAAGALAQAPNTLMYQGKLTDAVGPISTSVSVVFRIYDVDAGGTALWTETQSVTPNELGVFSVQLGSVTDFPPDLFTGGVLYLGIEVGGDGEMVPRSPITSVPYAFGSPGIAHNYLDNHAVTDAVTAPLEVAVRVSRPGYIVLEASGWTLLTASTTMGAWIAIAVGSDAAVLDPVSVQWIWAIPNPGSVADLKSFCVRKLVPVAPGDYTYYLTVQKGNTQSADIINIHLTATFVPTWIGTDVPPSPAASPKISTEFLDRLKTSLTESINQGGQ